MQGRGLVLVLEVPGDFLRALANRQPYCSQVVCYEMRGMA